MTKYILFLLLLSTAVSSVAQSYFPAKNANWEERSPAEFGADGSLLDAAVTFAMENEYSGSRDLRRAILKGFAREPYHEILGPTKKRGGPAGMVLKNGYLIAKWGDIQRVDMTFSVTKSFLSTVAGVAADRGLISSTSDRVEDYVWDGTFEGAHNSKISWAHLLQQNSDWSGQLWGIKDWADRPPREGGIDDWRYRELREPGTVMEYNDVRVNVLAYSLTQLWRQPLPAVLKSEIMDPIDASTTWRWFGYKDAWAVIDGYRMKSVTGGGHSGGGIFINTEDMARFGLLFANNGNWDGKQVLSETWISEAVTPSKPNNNYGYMWWLNTEGEEKWSELDDHIFYAQGFGGNVIMVDRERQLVVVTRWLEPSKIEAFMQLLYKAF